jgi:glutamate dehydrogenase (NADP+)
MDREGAAIWALAKDRKISIRSAAYVHALGRLADAIQAHGTQQFFTT